ncbi:phosphotransferase [Synechococcales cyanobacterium C]|uniref:Phosphotransferase n=1 Tax=Petrachloros mirabilis ULC683 TaxID=2781853 RepID=A0A8K1ZY56_9CYAN|nr:aminoglycoside phosphotransferase family protein [Petrachloros mirabilis]NCJ06256.1 phosphotransferase [Petrachloros mirabilis ULC683]
MPCSADQSLVECDSQLPGLATLLDDAAMLKLLQTHGWDVQQLTSAYVRYKPYTNCLVAYEVKMDRRTTWLYGKVYPLAQLDKLAKYQRLGRRTLTSGGQPLIVEALGLAILPFPLDRALPTVVHLLDPTTQKKLSQKLLPLGTPTAAISLKTLTYKPERRYVAQACLSQGEEQSWVVKAYTQENFTTARRNSRDVQGREVLQIAPLAGRSRHYQMLAFPWIDGQPLPERMQQTTPTALRRMLEPVGIALAELHQQRLKRLQRVSCAAEALDLMELVSDLCYLNPRLSPTIKTLSRRMANALLYLPQQWQSTHGDFKPDQVLVHPPRVTLIDLDRAAQGHPARDLGSFIAQLEYQNLRGELPDSDRQAAVVGLLKGYDAAQGAILSADSIRLYTALHLFKLLPEPFRYREPNWPTRMEQLLARIQTHLQPSCSDLDWSA